MPKVVDRNAFLNAVKSKYGNITTISRKQVMSVCEESGVPVPNWLLCDNALRAGYGMYNIDPKAVFSRSPQLAAQWPIKDDEACVAMAAPLRVVSSEETSSDPLIPSKAPGYVPFGNYSDVRAIVKSNKFYPIYITGLSGNGKTVMVEQVCAVEKREMVRVNITIETDEDDLLGGFRLIDGRTVWQNGPVINAMERGAILLLDEVDLGSNKMMCLQPVLEGKSIYLKKINKLIKPAEGFNIIATANTKGKGSEDGRFIGTNVMNEAFLERFSITMEQEYPPVKVEQKIISNVLGFSGIEDNDFVEKLVNWASVIRQSFYDGAVSEIISTRRLIHICEAYAIFDKKREKAINLCLNRFDVDTKTSFFDLYKKLDDTMNPPTKMADPVTPIDDTVEVAF